MVANSQTDNQTDHDKDIRDADFSLSEDLHAFLAKREKQQRHFDVLIIGSGYGGSIAASELSGTKDPVSNMPLNICVLERGKQYLPGMFPSKMAELPGHIRYSGKSDVKPHGARIGLFDIRMGDDVVTLLASGLGGGSLINAGVLEKPDSAIFQHARWPSEVRKLFGATTTLAHDPANPSADMLFAETARLLGQHDTALDNRDSHRQSEFLEKNLRHRELGSGEFRYAKIITVLNKEGYVTEGGIKLRPCNNCGDCMTGCNHSAKVSLDTSLLAKAKRKAPEHVSLVTGATVLRFERDQDHWVIHVQHTDASARLHQGPAYQITANKLILAAGSLGSTELLLRSQSSKLQFSSRLGQQFSTNGDNVLAVYDLPDEVNAVANEGDQPELREIGPTITGIIDTNFSETSDPQGRFLAEEFSIPGPLRRVFEEIFTTANIVHGLSTLDLTDHHQGNSTDLDPCAVNPTQIKHSSLIGVNGHDSADGLLTLKNHDKTNETLGDGLIQVVWPHLKKADNFESQISKMQKLFNAMPEKKRGKAKLIPNPLWRPLPDNLKPLLDGNSEPGPLLTVHPIGGCPMGEHIESGVVDAYGRVYDAHQSVAKHASWFGSLLVLDAAIIPTSIGVNPTLSIATLTRWAIVHLRDRVWHLQQGEDSPLATIKLPVFRTPVYQKPVETKVELIERLTGTLPMPNSNPKEKFRIELTLKFEPVALSYLSSNLQRVIKFESGTNTKTNTSTCTLREYRNETAWRNAYDQDVSSQALNQVNECSTFNIERGYIQILNRPDESSDTSDRIKRTLWPWWRNRGKRDIWQWLDAKTSHSTFMKKIMLAYVEFCVLVLHKKSADIDREVMQKNMSRLVALFDRFLGKKASNIGDAFSNRISLFLAAASHAGEQRVIHYTLYLENGELIEGKKVLSYDIAANPLLQLNELQLTSYRGRKIPERKKPKEKVDEPMLFGNSYGFFLLALFIWAGQGILRKLINPVRHFFFQKVSSEKISDTRPDGVLVLDTRYLTRKHLPLIRITSEKNLSYPTQPDAIVDLVSFGLYMTRLMAQIHLWTFRKPDDFPLTLSPPKDHRLPGLLDGLDEPKIIELKVASPLPNGVRVKIRLTRYRSKTPSVDNSAKTKSNPILMIHGYSASGTTFAHPAIPLDLTRYLLQQHVERDIWILDMRSSCGMPTATHSWTMEEIGCNDIPVAVAHIVSVTGRKVDVVAHCVGCAMFSMAVLIPPQAGDDHFAARLALPNSINSAVLSQYGPVVAVTPDNNLRSFVMNYVRLYLDNTAYQFKSTPEDNLALLDRLLASLPYPSHEFMIENPIDTQDEERFEEIRPWTSIRHRMDLLYGRTFNLENMDLRTLNQIDDFFGPMNLDTLAQMTQFSRYRRVTNRQGQNALNLPESMPQYWLFPTLSLHSEKNGMIDFSTKKLMENLFQGFNHVGYESFVCEGLGHQDTFIGTKEATESGFNKISNFLDAVQSGVYISERKKRKQVRTQIRVEIPFMGPFIKASAMPMTNFQNQHLEFCVAASPAKPLPKRLVVLCGINADSDVWSGDINRVLILLDLELDAAAIVDGWIHGSIPLASLPEDGEWRPERANVLLAYKSEIFIESDGVEAAELDDDEECAEAYMRLASELYKNNDPREFEKSAIALNPVNSDAFALASCQYSKGVLDELPASTSIRRLARRFNTNAKDDRLKPSFLLLLGDQIYIDETAGVFNPDTQEDLDQRKYEMQYHESIGLRTVLQNIPCWRMLDDHEIEDNWEPSFQGDTNNDSRVRESEQRRELGIKKYWRNQRMTGPQAFPGNLSALYFTLKQKLNGEYFDFFVCDTRTERACRYDFHGPIQSEIFKNAQQNALFTWLLEQRNNDKPKFICSPAIFLPRLKSSSAGHANPWLSDAWDGFPKSMTSLLKFILDEQIKNVVFLSGDAHLCCTLEATISEAISEDNEPATMPNKITILSIHSSGLYSPYPFANAQWEEFADRETFYFEVNGERYRCELVAQQSQTQGDGFAMITPVRDEENQWGVNVEFDLSGGRSTRELRF